MQLREPHLPEPGEISLVVNALERGDLILVKGDIGYGFFSISENGLQRMYRLKQRPLSNPSIVIGNLNVLREIAFPPHEEITQWLAQMIQWTTLAVVLPAKPKSILNNLPPWVYSQTVTNNTVALFLQPGEFLEQVTNVALERGFVVVGSSANPSGHGNIYDPKELPSHFLNGVDLFINHGVAKYANSQRLATTIVDLCRWRIKRKGVNWELIEKNFKNLKQDILGQEESK